MTVLYVLKRYPRLSETFIVRELIGVEALGVRVLVDALLPPEDEPRHPEVELVGARPRYLPRRPSLRIVLAVAARAPRATALELGRALALRRAGDPRAIRRWRQAVLVAERARREGVAVIHAHFATAAAEVARAAGRMAGVPVTVTAHAKDIFHTENAPVLRRRLADVQTLVTVSEFNRAHLAVVAPDTLTRVVRNGVALGPVNTLHVGTRSAPVLTVSRLVAKKGLDTLVRAIALVDDPLLHLDVIGGGPLLGELCALAEELGVADRVTFHGPQPSRVVDAAYAGCSLVALPCRVDGDGDRDGLPTVLVEALARGIPVVSTSVVGIPELVRHEQTGLLVPPDDPAALAAAIGRLRSDATQARALGLTGRRLVEAQYAPADSAKALLAVWQEAAA